MEVEGNRLRDRLRKVWMKTLEDNMTRCALPPADAKDISSTGSIKSLVKNINISNLSVGW
jgi:hypothetical protein